MAQQGKTDSNPPQDDLFGVVLEAAVRADVHRPPAPPPESREEARAAFLKALRHRPGGRLSRMRRRRMLSQVAVLVGCGLAILLSALWYLVADFPETLETPAYAVDLDVSGSVLARFPGADHWVMRTGAARRFRAGTVLVAPVGQVTTMSLRDAGLVMECQPGTRLAVTRGRQRGLTVLAGQLVVRYETGEDSGLPGGMGGALDLRAGGRQRSPMRHRLQLALDGTAVAVDAGSVGTGRVAQVTLLEGEAVVRRGPLALTLRTPLLPGRTYLFAGAAVASWSTAMLRSGASGTEPLWAAAHWQARPGGSREAPGPGALLPALNAEDAVVQLSAIVDGKSAAASDPETRLAALETLGLLDSYEAISSLVVRMQPETGLRDESLRIVGRFQDPRSRLLMEQSLQDEAHPLDADAAARTVLSLARLPHGLERHRQQAQALLERETLSPDARIQVLQALALARTDAGGDPSVEIDALIAASSTGEEPLRLAALAALEELAAREARGAPQGIVPLLEDPSGRIAAAAEAALVSLYGHVESADGANGRQLAQRWRAYLAGR